MSTPNETTRALLRGEPLPAKLEELRMPLLGVIDELAEEVARFAGDPEEAALRERLLGDGSQTVTIMGQRGSGKSTLLAAVTAKLLRDQRHLVVPIMRPDQFGEPDSVITTFLAELWDLLCAKEERGGEAQGDAEASKLLADATRGSAMARTTTAALEQGTESPSDFADDFVAVSRSGVRLARQLRRLAQELCYPRGEREEARVIVVPIDDPDLARHNIIDILTDLQILSSVTGIVPLTCFSPDDLNGAWLSARQRNLPEATERHLHFLLARQMEKAFPYRFRFEIEPIAPTRRAVFTPIANTAPLSEKLSGLRAQVERLAAGPWPFDDAITLEDERFGLRSPLPDNARTLVQLWESLDAVEGANAGDSDALHLALRRLLNILVERVAARLGRPASQLIHVGPPSRASDGVRALQMEFTNVRLLPSATSATEEVHKSRLATIQLHKLHELRAAKPSGDSGSSEYKPEDFLEREEVAAVLALQDVAYGTGLFDVSGTRLRMSTSEWSFLQEVELANQATDDAFLLLPDATTLSEVLRGGSLWNQLADLSPQMGTEAALATTIEAACLTLEPDAELTVQQDYEEAFERAAGVYSEALERRGSSSRAFVLWFERDLPLQWHSALLGASRIRMLAERHRELRSQPKRLEYREPIDATLFEARLEFLLDSLESDASSEGGSSGRSWVAGYFELASAFESDDLPRLSTLYPKWQRDCAGVRAGAVTVGALERQDRSTTRAAPYPTPEGTDLLAAGLAALRRALRASYADLHR